MLTPWKESYDQPRQHLKKQRHYFANKGPSSQGYGFSSGHVWMWELDYKESWVLMHWCFWTVVLKKSLSPFNCKEIQPVHPKVRSVLGVHWKDWCWSWYSNNFATSCEELTHWKSPWCWERLRARGEGDDRGWDGWMASRTQGTWVWVNSGSWWWTGRPGVLQSMGSERAGHNWVTELNWDKGTEHEHAPIYIPTSSAWGVPFLHILCKHMLFFVFLIRAILTGIRWYLTGLACIFLRISDVENLSMCLLVICMSSLKNVYSGPLPIF